MCHQSRSLISLHQSSTFILIQRNPFFIFRVLSIIVNRQKCKYFYFRHWSDTVPASFYRRSGTDSVQAELLHLNYCRCYLSRSLVFMFNKRCPPASSYSSSTLYCTVSDLGVACPTRSFVENCSKFVEKFSGIFGIILLIFLENLVIFSWGGGAREECKKMLDIFGTF